MLTQTLLKQGPGIPLVFLHGFLGSSLDWLPVCSHLPPCLCIGVDLPGHGLSPFTEDFCSAMPDFPAMHLIGYSMGGRLAMQYAARFPQKIASLTLLSAHTGLASVQEKQERLALDRQWAEKMRLCFQTFLQEWYAQPIFAGFKPDRPEQNPEPLSRALLHYSLGNQPMMQPQARFLVGERDLKYRALFPEATIISNAGHMIHLENPQETALKIYKK
jgi:2-succinyl-6-hydroxy-2,4-cyclohexadiene-1-carboxylate synthase